MCSFKTTIVWLRTATSVAHAFRAPICGAVLISASLCFPLQIIEIYRALAQDLLYADTSHLGPKLRFVAGVLFCVICVISIWITSKTIAQRGFLRASLATPIVARLPKVLAGLPIVGLALGVYAGSTSLPTMRADHAMLRILSYVFDETDQVVLDVIKDRLLGYNFYLAVAALVIAIVAVALIFFLPVVHQHSSEHPKPNHSTPIELFDRRSRLTIYVGAVALAFLVVWLPVSLPQVMGPLGILFAFVTTVPALIG